MAAVMGSRTALGARNGRDAVTSSGTWRISGNELLLGPRDDDHAFALELVDGAHDLALCLLHVADPDLTHQVHLLLDGGPCPLGEVAFDRALELLAHSLEGGREPLRL